MKGQILKFKWIQSFRKGFPSPQRTDCVGLHISSLLGRVEILEHLQPSRIFSVKTKNKEMYIVPLFTCDWMIIKSRPSDWLIPEPRMVYSWSSRWLLCTGPSGSWSWRFPSRSSYWTRCWNACPGTIRTVGSATLIQPHSVLEKRF